MANKRITELTLRSDVSATCNFPVDDTIQSYRVTAPQVVDFVKNTLKEVTIDAASGSVGVTLTRDSEKFQVFNPSSNINVKLDNSFLSGHEQYVFNSGTAFISLIANDNSVIRTIYPNTIGKVICVSDTPATNAGWLGLNRVTSNWIAGSTPTAQLGSGWGSAGNGVQFYKRDGDTMHWHARWENGTVTTNAANCELPLSLSIDTAKIGATLKHIFPGRAYTILNSGSSIPQYVVYYNATAATAVWFSQASNADSVTAQNVPTLTNSSDYFTFHVSLPISGWSEYSG
jgi:hypothetical protein